jgi:prepilin-type N-terminal cleavage/methylation domain-containing protein
MSARSGRRRAGFTLTELLVVIAIIMALAAAAAPALQVFRRSQRLDGAARVVTASLSEARRAAVTKHARQVVVLYKYEDQTVPPDTLGRVRYAMRIYCEPVGDPSWTTGYFRGGYVGDTILLPVGICFAQDKMKFAQVFGPVPDPSKPLPLDSEYFRKSPQSKAIGFRRDGTFDYDATLDEPARNPAAGRNIYMPDERVYQVPDDLKGDIVLAEIDPQGHEVKVKGKARRAYIDLAPATGRAMSAVFEIGDSFQTE